MNYLYDVMFQVLLLIVLRLCMISFIMVVDLDTSPVMNTNGWLRYHTR